MQQNDIRAVAHGAREKARFAVQLSIGPAARIAAAGIAMIACGTTGLTSGPHGPAFAFCLVLVAGGSALTSGALLTRLLHAPTRAGGLDPATAEQLGEVRRLLEKMAADAERDHCWIQRQTTYMCRDMSTLRGILLKAVSVQNRLTRALRLLVGDEPANVRSLRGRPSRPRPGAD